MPKRMDDLQKKVTAAGEALTDVVRKTTENVSARIDRMREKLEPKHQRRSRTTNPNMERVR